MNGSTHEETNTGSYVNAPAIRTGYDLPAVLYLDRPLDLGRGDVLVIDNATVILGLQEELRALRHMHESDKREIAQCF